MLIVYHPLAWREVEESTEYYQTREASLGQRFLADIERAFSVLEQHPNIGQVELPGIRRFLLADFPYKIVYMLRGERLWVLAVSHVHRRPRYWAKRRPVS